VTDGTHTARLVMLGNYVAANFHLANDALAARWCSIRRSTAAGTWRPDIDAGPIQYFGVLTYLAVDSNRRPYRVNRHRNVPAGRSMVNRSRTRRLLSTAR